MITNFSEKLKELRKEKGLSVVDLSKIIGFSKIVIYFWENGQREPTSNALIALSDFFGVSIDYLVGRENDEGNIIIVSDSSLPEEEKRLLNAFRSLNNLEKNKLIDDAEFYAKRSAQNFSAKANKN